MKLPTGDTYTGTFKDGKRDGQGTTVYADGYKYVGGFKNDYRGGQGTMTFPDGTKLSGLWAKGKFVR